MNRATVIETEDFKLELELGQDGEHILHMPHLKKWTPSIYKKLLGVAASLHEWAKEHDVSVMYTGAPVSEVRTLKFQTMLGFEPFGIVEFRGEPFQVMRQGSLNA